MSRHRQESELESNIINWIKSNSYVIHPSYRWQIGVKPIQDLSDQQMELLGDLDCKYFKFWKTENLLDAISVIKKLKRHPEVDASEPVGSIKKGFYVFIYRTRADRPEYRAA